jgi:hypothetical protein
MSTILYNMLQYCSVLYNMKYLIVMHEFSDDPLSLEPGQRPAARAAVAGTGSNSASDYIVQHT